MDRETTLLAMLESKEAEAQARDEWIATWVESNQPLLLAGQLDTDAAALLGEVNADQAVELNQAIYLLMVTGDKLPMRNLIQQLMDQHLANEAEKHWGHHSTDLQNDMDPDQWDQYQQRTAH